MDIEKIKIFLTVVEEGSLYAAAKKLDYTTSGISRSVTALEEETGLQLILRGKKGISVTKDAQTLLPIMKELVYQNKKYEEKVQELKGLEKGTVSIGIAYSYYFEELCPILKKFSKEHPGIEIKTVQKTSSELYELMMQHEIDFSIMTFREGNFHFIQLKDDPMVACVYKNHPSVKNGFFELNDFQTEPMVAAYPDLQTDYSIALKNAGIVPNIRYTTMDVNSAYRLVENELGVSMFNQLEVYDKKADVVILPTKPEVMLQIGIMHTDWNEMSLSARSLFEEIRKQFR